MLQWRGLAVGLLKMRGLIRFAVLSAVFLVELWEDSSLVLIHHYSAIDASVGSSADVMSTANTYIVYSALIVTAVAAFMTIAGLIFTQHFSMEKERNLSRAYDTLIEELKIENEKAEKIMKEIMKNP